MTPPVNWANAHPRQSALPSQRWFRYGEVKHPDKGCVLTFLEEPRDATGSGTKVEDAVFVAEVMVQHLGTSGEKLGEPVKRTFTANPLSASDYKAHGETGQPFKGTRWLLKKNVEANTWNAVPLVT